MKSLAELQELTGYSRDQLKRRLALLRAQGLDGVHRGAHGALLVPDSVADLLSRMAELERQGVSPREALNRALDGAQKPPVGAEECTMAHPSAQPGTPTRPGAPSTELEAELLRVLWALFALLAVATAGILGLGIAAVVTK